MLPTLFSRSLVSNLSHSFEFSIFFPEFSASSPPAPLEFGAYLAHSHAGPFAFLDSDSPRQELSIDAWVIWIGPVVAELFAFWSLSGFWTCRVDISGSKARNHYSFRILTALYTGNTVLSRFGDPLHRSSVMLHVSPSPPLSENLPYRRHISAFFLAVLRLHALSLLGSRPAAAFRFAAFAPELFAFWCSERVRRRFHVRRWFLRRSPIASRAR